MWYRLVWYWSTDVSEIPVDTGLEDPIARHLIVITPCKCYTLALCHNFSFHSASLDQLSCPWSSCSYAGYLATVEGPVDFVTPVRSPPWPLSFCLLGFGNKKVFFVPSRFPCAVAELSLETWCWWQDADSATLAIRTRSRRQCEIKGGSNMTGNDFFVTIIAHHSSNSQTGLNRF